MAGAGKSGLPRRRDPDLAGLAAFTVGPRGEVTSWPVTAEHLFGRPEDAVVGQDVCDVLMTGPGQRELMGQALAEVAAGRLWTTTVAGGKLGDGRFAIRCEPLSGVPNGTLVIVQRAWPQPGPSWLSEAAARIGSTLDLTQTAAEIVNVAVPGFADAAVIYVTERLLVADDFTSLRAGSGVAVRRLAARLAGLDATATDSLLRPSEILVFGADSLHSRAMAQGQPVLLDPVDDETAARLGSRPAGQELMSRYSAFLAMPLIARGTVVGCAMFGRAPTSQAFGPADVTLAAELASRAAVCIDNARLYDRERRTALALQQGLLPARPQVPAGMEVAHRYVPVGDSVVGGDWYDIVPLSGGRAALIVGDAMGHGPEAAAVMVQLRTAAHTLADLELAPGEVLRRLDRMAAGITAAPFATCIYTVIDPAERLVCGRPGGPPAAGAREPRRRGADAAPAARPAARPGCRVLPGDRDQPAARGDPRPVHRRAGGEPHPDAGPRHGRAAGRPQLQPGRARCATGQDLRHGDPGAARSRRG